MPKTRQKLWSRFVASGLVIHCLSQVLSPGAAIEPAINPAAGTPASGNTIETRFFSFQLPNGFTNAPSANSNGNDSLSFAYVRPHGTDSGNAVLLIRVSRPGKGSRPAKNSAAKEQSARDGYLNGYFAGQSRRYPSLHRGATSNTNLDDIVFTTVSWSAASERGTFQSRIWVGRQDGRFLVLEAMDFGPSMEKSLTELEAAVGSIRFKRQFQ